MHKFTELPGASPPGPPPGLCPGPAGGLTAPPRPPAVFLVPMAAPLPKCFRRACSELTTQEIVAAQKLWIKSAQDELSCESKFPSKL